MGDDNKLYLIEGAGCMGEGVVFRFRELYFLRFSVIMINLNTPPPLPPFF